jgi:formylglycine-generating enzyme required for sulfatase activity
LPFRYRGSRRESAVAQLFSLGGITHQKIMNTQSLDHRVTNQKKAKNIFMRIGLRSVLVALLLNTAIHPADAQSARYFRVSGPAATTITAFQPDGTLVWNNALAGTNYTIQTVTSLPGGTNWVDYVQLPVTTGVNTNRLIDPNPPSGMALIPAGSFTMGDNLDGSGYSLPLHSVYVSAFYMDKYDVTYAMWQTVYNWAITNGYNFDHAGSRRAADHPVQTIDWYDSVKWCNARSEMEGRTPAYYTDDTQATIYRTGQVDVDNSSVKWNAGYRLPTEAEWEKAARGGASGQRFPWGNTISWSQANYYGLPSSYAYDLATASTYNPAFAAGDYPYTSPVGYFAPNGYGLYDMTGNVVQWCWDWSDSYGSASQNDPRGPTTGSLRVIRGGSWGGSALDCRAASRTDYNPIFGGWDRGFRCALAVGQ